MSPAPPDGFPEESNTVVAGRPKLGRFSALKISARNSMFKASLNAVFFARDAFQRAMPGPIIVFFPTLPSSRGPGAENAAGLKYLPCPVGSFDLFGGPQVMLSRVKPGTRLGEAKPVPPRSPLRKLEASR